MTDTTSHLIPPNPEGQKCGFASIIGLPNAGKSTLLNTLVGTKISIVSRKVQTTRNRILGIVLEDGAQVILMDTPGIFHAQKRFDKAMVSAALDSAQESDIVLHLVDCRVRNAVQKNKDLIAQLPKNKHCVLVLNKVDGIHKPELLQIVQDFQAAYDYQDVFMISALKANGTDKLLSYLAEKMPEGVWMFPEDQITDLPMRMLAAELTREQIFHQLHEELPYAIFVETEQWENFDNGSVKISQVIFVEKESQKHIVIGKGGSRLKSIGQRVREELEEMLETRVHVKLFVKVQKNWHENMANYQLLGLEYPS